MKTISYLFLLLPSLVFSQNLSQNRYFTIQYENDFFAATDQYYTQGIRYEWVNSKFRRLPTRYLLPDLGMNALNYYGLRMKRDGFTPEQVTDSIIRYGDHPYGGYTCIGHFLVSNDATQKQRLSTDFAIGIMGPIGGGQVSQTLIHKWTRNVKPLGWKYQIANDVVLKYEIRYDKMVFSRPKWIEMIAFGQAKVGTLYDNIGGGGLIRIGKMNSYFGTMTGLAKKGTAEHETSQKFQLYLFMQARGEIVGYNAMLQGGIFNRKSPYTVPNYAINRFIAEGYIGATAAYKGVSVDYFLAYLTPEFSTQTHHQWGGFTLKMCL